MWQISDLVYVPTIPQRTVSNDIGQSLEAEQSTGILASDVRIALSEELCQPATDQEPASTASNLESSGQAQPPSSLRHIFQRVRVRQNNESRTAVNSTEDEPAGNTSAATGEGDAAFDDALVVADLLLVRIKQRRSFHYTPKGAQIPAWRFDFTLVWSGKTLQAALHRQRILEPEFEIECECIDPVQYFQAHQSDKEVAAGLLLKIRDFLEPWGGYKLLPLDRRSQS